MAYTSCDIFYHCDSISYAYFCVANLLMNLHILCSISYIIQQLVDQRSEELLKLVSDLGPTFIKIGQALSTRTDLLPAKYAKGLTGLQDKVPPFSGESDSPILPLWE